LTAAEDVTAHILVLVATCVEDWFPPSRPMPLEDFIDCLCVRYGNAEGWDIESLDSLAVRRIVRHARYVRREIA
jgi:hypothetical protein